ncbi:hypothetical protein BSKO_01141 [Bryopsis sp. KO-2023]|nr:hypothetical protein BSKO_01141 [Bryopsis sp. KO-2023]
MIGGCVAVLLLLIAVTHGQTEDEILDQCEAAGLKAGSFAYRASCMVLKATCPPSQYPVEDETFTGRSLFTDALIAEVIRDSCQLLFKGSCEAAAFETALEKDEMCADLLFNGPDPVNQCPDLAAAVQIFAETSARLCNQEPPPFKKEPEPVPEAEITFRARGNAGKEVISGLKLITKTNVVRLIQVKCSDTGSGALTNEEQDCISFVPREIRPEDVREVKIVFGNPVNDKNSLDHNIQIVDGKVWFLGRNIWRSAIDSTVSSVLKNTDGKLDSLRKGNLNFNEGDMLSPPPSTSLWLEARGTSGGEVLTISAKLTNGKWQGIPLRCTGTNNGQLRTSYQVCTGHFTGAPSDVELLVFQYDDQGGTTDIIIKDGRVMFFGVNVWWQANSSQQDAISKNEGGRLWRLRAGDLNWSGIQAFIDTSEYL